MRSSFTVETGLKLVRTPNYRHRALRRRWLVGGAVIVLVIAGGLMETARTPETPSAPQLAGISANSLQTHQEILP